MKTLATGSLLPVLAVLLQAGPPEVFAQTAPYGSFTEPPLRPTSGECSSLVSYSQTYSNCITFGNCSGAYCHLEQFLTGYTASVWMEETCADPVVVMLGVDGPSNSSLSSNRGVYRVGGDGLGFTTNSTTPITATYGRNASHLHFQARTTFEGDIAVRLIPMITMPLNPRQCMCQSMQEVANVIGIPLPILFVNLDLSCSPRSDCTGITCNITFGTLGQVAHYIADVTIDPCGETVRFVVTNLTSSRPSFDQRFNDSGSYPISGPNSLLQATLLIGMVHHNYSMDLSTNCRLLDMDGGGLLYGEQVRLQVASIETENILPSRKIILDRSHCTNPKYYYESNSGTPGTTSSPGTTAPSAVSMTTATPPISPPVTLPQPSNCPGADLDVSAAVAAASSCNFLDSCAGVECTSRINSNAFFEIEKKCADPVMVDFEVDASPEQFSVGGDGWGSSGDIGGKKMKVEYGRNATHLHFKAIDATSNAVIIPKAQIPLYPHNCMCQSMDAIASSVNFMGSPIPITPTCSRRTDCDGISCLVTAGFGSSTVSDNFHLLIDPCRESVRFTNTNSSGMTMFDEVYNDTGVYDLKLLPGANTKLSVGIVHRNFSMRLSMVIVGSPNITILSPQEIILDRSNCSHLTYYYSKTGTNPTVSPDDHSSSGGSQQSQAPPSGHSQHSPSLALVVGVPFAILILLAGGLLTAIILVLALWRIRKRRWRAYTFQRMTFNEVDDDEDK